MERHLLTSDWFSISLLVIFSALVVLKLSDNAKFARLVRLEYIDYYWLLNNRERHFLSYFEVVVFLVSHLIFAQFLVVFFGDSVNSFFNFDFTRIQLILALLGITTLLSFVKFYFERFLNFTINQHSLIVFFIFYKQFVWTYALLLALPFLILHEYLALESEVFKHGALLVFMLFSLYHLFRFGYKNRTYLLRNWYYFILYICTLEILPYFLIYKLFTIK